MLHFIPAWYQQNTWCENEQSWYVRRMHTEFDDTVKQIQLFHRSKIYPCQLLLLGYSPNLRHFLHRQGVYHAPYWSCFDAIQGIKRKKMQILSYHNLKWPPHTEFLYTPFAVVAQIEGVQYAQVEFGEDGNPIRVDLFEQDRVCRRNHYDDRGFLSSTVVYEDGRPVYQDYLMENGIWKLRSYLTDGHVEVNPEYREYTIVYTDCERTVRFLKQQYDSLDQVICEVLATYLELTDRWDIFCVAMHEQHAELLRELLPGKLHGQQTILSFFESRYRVDRHPEVREILKRVGYVVTDSMENTVRIEAMAGSQDLPVMNIPPYDTRTDFGISQQLNIQKILIPVDGIEETAFREMIAALGRYLPSNEKARVYLFTRQADYDRENRLLEWTRKCLRELKFPEEWAAGEENGFIAENELEEQTGQPVLFHVVQCVDELAVSRCVREQRIMVDMRKQPELYMQITALSAGIPQIVSRKTQFVRQGKNGCILKDIKKLPAVLHYYLGSLTNWNDAMVCSYRLVKQYTVEVLLEKWKEVIDSVE